MERKPSYEELVAKLSEREEIIRALRNEEVDAVLGTRNVLLLRLKSTEDENKSLLQEKDLLLREVHHRIKNDMIAVMSLLTLQSKTLDDPKAIDALEEAQSRLQSMMLLYDKLYRTTNLREMSIKEYLPALVDKIFSIFPNKASLKIEIEIEDFMLGAATFLPLGIIVNELLTNIMKYAFIGRQSGLITVWARAKDNQAMITIEDNGVGIPESIDLETSCGFGLKLVDMLTSQLNGTIRIERDKGTRFILEFETQF